MKLGYMNVNGLNVGKIENLMSECNDRRLDVMCLTETHWRETMILNEKAHLYRVIGKGRSKQEKKDGGCAILIRKE